MTSVGCIPPLVKLLESQDVQVINVCLDALENILRLGEAERTIDGDNQMAICVEEADGVEIIQNLQYHQEEGASGHCFSLSLVLAITD